jgi:hypothetical protein
MALLHQDRYDKKEDLSPLVPYSQQIAAVGMTAKDRFSIIAPTGYVVNGSWIFYTQRSCHCGTLLHQERNDKKKDLTPYFTIFHISHISPYFHILIKKNLT